MNVSNFFIAFFLQYCNISLKVVPNFWRKCPHQLENNDKYDLWNKKESICETISQIFGGEFFLADSGGKCLRDLFFNYLYFNRINREQAKKDSQTSLQMWVDRKKIHSNKRQQFNLSKYVEPISSSSSYDFIITLLVYTKASICQEMHSLIFKV